MKRQILALATLLALGLSQVMAQDNSTAASVAALEQTGSKTDSILLASDSVFNAGADSVFETAAEDCETSSRVVEYTDPSSNWMSDDGPVTWQMVFLVLIIVGIPCVAVSLVLIVLFRFLHKRNRERNEVIARAIDKDYKLPESFFTKQPSYTPPTIVSSAPSENKENGENSSANFTEQTSWQNQPALPRNPRTFSTGMTLVAIGLAIFLACAAASNIGLGFIIGGIPMFIGIAKLVGYFFVPGFGNSSPQQRPPRNQGPENFGRQHYDPRYDRNYDTRYNPRYDQSYDPRFDPRHNPNFGNQGGNQGYADAPGNYGQPDVNPENPPRKNPGDGCPPVPPEYRE